MKIKKKKDNLGRFSLTLNIIKKVTAKKRIFSTTRFKDD